MKNFKRMEPLKEEELRAKIKKAVSEGRIEMASTEEIEKAEAGVKRVLIAIAPFMSESMTPEEWADNCLVSDMSTVGDFLDNEKDLEKLSKKLGFNVTRETYIKDVAVTI